MKVWVPRRGSASAVFDRSRSLGSRTHYQNLGLEVLDVKVAHTNHAGRWSGAFSPFFLSHPTLTLA
jgi:hypothetical protein